MDPYRFLGFRVFSLTAGRFKRAAYWLKALLVTRFSDAPGADRVARIHGALEEFYYGKGEA